MPKSRQSFTKEEIGNVLFLFEISAADKEGVLSFDDSVGAFDGHTQAWLSVAAHHFEQELDQYFKFITIF